jgi:hypothetical protein
MAITCPKCKAEVEITTSPRSSGQLGYGINNRAPIVALCIELKAAPVGTKPNAFQCKALDAAILAAINPQGAPGARP